MWAGAQRVGRVLRRGGGGQPRRCAASSCPGEIGKEDGAEDSVGDKAEADEKQHGKWTERPLDKRGGLSWLIRAVANHRGPFQS